MSSKRKSPLVCAALSLLAILMAPQAAAAESTTPAPDFGYAQEVADGLRTDHVFVDPTVTPTIDPQEAERLTSQIAETGKPIYVAVLDENRARLLEGDSWYDSMRGALGLDLSIMVLYTQNGYGVHTYSLPQVGHDIMDAGLRDRLDASLTRDGDTIDLYTPTSEWIDIVNRIEIIDLPATAPAPTGQSAMPWRTLAVALAICALIGLAAFLYARRTRRTPRRPRK
jgi:hypothetical protein